jgi:hypothetical protein
MNKVNIKIDMNKTNKSIKVLIIFRHYKRKSDNKYRLGLLRLQIINFKTI